jgi:alpha-L-rhamnosidase
MFICLSLTASLFGFAGEKNDNILHPQNLRCEYLANPLGIDILKPRLSWFSTSNQRNQKQTAYRILAASSLKKLSTDEGDLWDTKKVLSDESINIVYSGKKLNSGDVCYWKVKLWDANDNESDWSEPASWSMGLLDKTDWKGFWIGLDSLIGNDKQFSLSARYVRKEFDAAKKIKRATAYICGVGLFELYINGNKIGDQVLAPALSEYPKRSYYMTFDVTKEIEAGKNAVGVILGAGRYFSPIKWDQHYGFPKMIFQLNIEFSDGNKESIVSDSTWKITADGPIIFNNEFQGEHYDATKEMPGWNQIDFDDSKWIDAERVGNPSEVLSAQMIEPIKIMETINPKSINEIEPGVYVYDMGQNMVGWVSLKVSAARDTKIKLRYAENINQNGQLDTFNLRLARSTDIYIANGNGVEIWQPRFTYHGFRYVELSGYQGKPDLSTIIGKVIYDNIRTTGHFTCSNETINKIYNTAYWGIRGNYRSLPTDCPQRDERHGWLGDRSTGSYGESFIFDNNALYSKWMTDIADGQKATGSISDVNPTYRQVYSDNMTWPSTFLFVPGYLYQQYGNFKVIADNYNAMKKWILYIRDKYMTDNLVQRDSYGDWCVPPKDPFAKSEKDSTRISPGSFIAAAYFYHCLNLMKNYASLLNEDEDSKVFASLSEKVRDAINNTYLDKNIFCYANNAVTANAIALSFNIPPKEIKSKVFNNLVEKIINDHNSHTGCGLIGQQWIMRTLTDNGNPELAFKFAANNSYPSWGYMVENGATTIWERWNGNTAPSSMNSHNHVMLLGDLIIWLYEELAGIKADVKNPGFKKIVMKPNLLGNLKFVEASYLSMFGLIKSNWKIEKDKFCWDVDVPPNTTATIYVPAEKESDVTENGKNLSVVAGVKFIKYEEGRAVYEIGSGAYNLVSKIKI